MPSESTPLVLEAGAASDLSQDFALSNRKMLTYLLGTAQAALVLLFMFGTTYDSRDYSPSEYDIFRDIMVM
jgi:hypothetical protein